jgi:hypothetical protein
MRCFLYGGKSAGGVGVAEEAAGVGGENVGGLSGFTS